MVSEQAKTLTEILMPEIARSPRHLRQLEQHRIKYEQQYGQTDLLARYTSMLPESIQEKMMIETPEAYVLGWPPYIQDYFRVKVHRKYVLGGQLDDASTECIRAYSAITRSRGNMLG